jgi:tape measure domain-containing protein
VAPTVNKMAKTAGRGLSYTAKLNVAEAIKAAQLLKKEIAGISGVSTSGKGFDTKPLTGFQQANLALKKALIESQVESQKLRAENLALSNSYKKGQISAQGLAAAERRVKKDRQDLAAATRAARQAQQAATGSYDEAVARLKELGRSIKSAEGGFKSTTPAIKAQINEYNTLNDALKKFDAKMGNHQRNVGNYKSALNGVLDSLKSLALGYLSVQTALQLATSSFNVNRQSQAIEASLKFTLGSTEAAIEKINELRANALLLGQDFLPVADSYAKFAGAARAANFPLAETDRIFKAVSVAGARFNLTSDQVSGALLAIQQMISKGNVQAEELRGQLGERLPGAFSIAAKAMGVTEKELNKLLQTGQVLAADLIPKLSGQLEKDFGLKAGENIDNLNASVGRLSTTFDTAVQGDGIGKFFKQIVDGAAAAIASLDKLVKSRSFGEVTARLFTFDASKYDRINSIQDNYSQSSKLTKDYNPIGASSSIMVSTLATKTLDELEKMRKAYLTATTQASAAANTYRRGIQSGEINDGGEVSLAAAERNFKKLQNALKEVNTAYNIVEARTPKVLTGTKELTDAQLTAIAAIRKRITDLSKLPDSAIDGSAINTRIDALKERLKALNGSSDQEYNAALNRAKALGSKLSDLHNDSIRNQKESDNAELDSVKDKYAKMREEAVAFYADSRNANVKVKVNGKNVSKSQVLGALKADEANDTEVVLAKQKVELTKQTIEDQKQLYLQFEDYKLQVGEKAATERFSSEMRGYKNFVEYLEGIMPREGDGTAYGVKLRDLIDKELLPKAESDELKKTVDYLSKLLTENTTYENQRKALIEQSQSDIQALYDKGYNDQAKQLERNTQDQLTELGIQNFQKLELYQDLFDNIDQLSTDAAEKQIKALYKLAAEQVKAGTITQKAYAEIVKGLNNADDAIKSKIPDGLKNIGTELTNIGSLVGDFDEGLGKALGTLGNIVSGIGEMKQGFADFNKAKENKNTLGQITSGLGLISSAIGIVTGLVGLFSNSKAKAEQAKYAQDLQLKATEAVNKALERQIALTEKLYGPERISAIKKSIADIAKAQKDVRDQIDKKISLTGDKGLDETIAKVNNGEKVFMFKGILDAINSPALKLAGKSIEDLQKLLDAGKLDEKTSALVQSLIELQQQAADTQNTLTEDITGINFDSLNDSIKSVFDSGEISAEKFADAIEKSIRGAFANAFQRNEIETAMQPFYDQLYQAGLDGTYTQNEIDTLRKSKEAIAKSLADRAKVYQDIIGKDPLATPDTASGMTGQLKAITEDTAQLLVGQFNGQRIATLQLVQHSMQANSLLTANGKSMEDIYLSVTGNFNQLVKIEANTLRTANNTDDLVPVLKRIETKMDSNANALAANGR